MTAQSVAPLFLRFALAVTFLWAGFGKVLPTMAVRGDRADTLAAMQVIDPPTPTTLPQSTSPLAGPTSSPPSDIAPPAPPAEVRVRRLYGLALLLHSAAFPPPVTLPASATGSSSVSPNPDNLLAGQPADASAPTVTTPMPLWPAALASGRLPVYFAWAAALTEIIAGLFLLVGLLTRVSALSLAGTMLAAIWLTEIGPAIQSGNTVLSFIPAYGPFAFDAANKFMFASLLWQTSLLCSALALTFTGPGALSFDRALFPPKAKSEDI